MEIHGAGIHWVKNRKPCGTGDMHDISQGGVFLEVVAATVWGLNAWGPDVGGGNGGGWVSSVRF